MLMDSIATLTRLLEYSEAERDSALAALRQAESIDSAAQAQASELNGYRGEYRQRWVAHFKQPGAIGLLHCYRNFGQRLDQAITQQDQSSGQATTRMQQARAQLVAREQRVAAVRKLIERRQAELRHIDERRAQRDTDEAAQRISAIARLGGLQP